MARVLIEQIVSEGETARRLKSPTIVPRRSHLRFAERTIALVVNHR